MSYLDELKGKRVKRTEHLSNVTKSCLEIINELIFLETKMLKLSKLINTRLHYKNKSNYLSCCMRFNYLDEKTYRCLNTTTLTPEIAQLKKVEFNPKRYRHTHKPEAIIGGKFMDVRLVKSISFELKAQNKKIKYLNTGTRWSRLIHQLAYPQYADEMIQSRKQLVISFKRYKKLCIQLAKIAKIVYDYGNESSLADTIHYKSDDEIFDIPVPEKIYPFINTRQICLYEIYVLIRNMNNEFEKLEVKIDKLIEIFNRTYHFEYGGLAFSWTLIERKSPLLEISNLNFWRITKPISDNGSRQRYKTRISNITRDYIREIKLKRFNNHILKSSREIITLSKQYKKLQKDSVAISKYLSPYLKLIIPSVVV